ncbi:hypothetical protein AAFF_G00207180 [Aldrovandia affinis]|uniref:Uncharacterized protein n=1 Tax=Aldrovandia affinis TaxID=143900 RepID=A0AAD7RHM7_9TELE|nr:hypothetical protein AAFF_G00207180 [Aldrovandia affinis]
METDEAHAAAPVSSTANGGYYSGLTSRAPAPERNTARTPKHPRRFGADGLGRASVETRSDTGDTVPVWQRGT